MANIEAFEGQNDLYGNKWVGKIIKSIVQLQKLSEQVTTTDIINKIRCEIPAEISKQDEENLKRRVRRTLKKLSDCEVIERDSHLNDLKATYYSYKIKWN